MVAQENWVLVPTAALAALCVTALRSRPGAAHPLAAAAVIRQEMLPALLPVAAAPAGLLSPGGGRLRRGALLTAAAGLPLLLLASER